MQSGNHAPSFASDLPCPRSDIYSYSDSYSYSYSDGVRWHLPASHLPRYSCKSVPGVSSCHLPGTVFLRKCSKCPFPPSTCHGIPARVFQVSLSAVHLARFSRESVPGVLSRRPPGTAVHLITGCRGFSSEQISSFQHEACNHQHTCSCGIHASF